MQGARSTVARVVSRSNAAAVREEVSMATADPIRALKEIVFAFNVADWPRLRAAISDDVVYEEVGTGRRLQGGDAYLELCKGWKTAFSNGHGSVDRELANGDSGALELTWTGTQSGPLEGPAGTLPASGRTFTMRSSFWCRADGGRAAELSHHLDMLTMLTDLGALPARTSTG
jgi:steroid delta-isomerase-like uncharacterized protein